MADFKMTCNSQKCVGNTPSKYVVKSENKFMRDCPDCGSVLFKDYGSNSKVKDNTTPKPKRDANHGLKNNPKEYV